MACEAPCDLGCVMRELYLLSGRDMGERGSGRAIGDERSGLRPDFGSRLSTGYTVLSTEYPRTGFTPADNLSILGKTPLARKSPTNNGRHNMTASSAIRLPTSALLLFALILAAGASPARAADDDAAKFVPLFDGKSFTGWEGDLKV